jgi:hypothetical protein
MEVLRTSQCFAMIDGIPRYVYTNVLYRLSDDMYHGRSLPRIPWNNSKKVDLENLEDFRLILVESYCPRFTADMTLALDTLGDSYYIKRPNLISYDGTLDISQLVLQEIKACEILRRHPHPNIAQYYGC